MRKHGQGKPVFDYNGLGLEQFRWKGPQALSPGNHTIVFDFKYDGPGIGKGGVGVLKVDRHVVATKRIPRTMPFLIPIDETFDVGVDTRTSVNPNDYQVPFPFNGKIEKLTFNLEPMEFDRGGEKAVCGSNAQTRVIWVVDSKELPPTTTIAL